MRALHRLAIVASHPVQYNSPWFSFLAAAGAFDLRVFYCWDFGVTPQADPGFGVEIQWDVPLLEGFEYEFVGNTSRNPGTQSFWGLRNPGLGGALVRFGPDAVLMIGYSYYSFVRLILDKARKWPLVLRGDSHDLVQRSGLRPAINAAFRRRLFRRFAAFLSVGHANREYLLNSGVGAERIFLAPHAVDNARFQDDEAATHESSRAWRSALAIPEGNRVVLFAGKFEEKKRPLDLLDAFVRAELRDTTLLFVGSGPLEPQLRARAHGVPGVVFAPFQNQRAMPRTYAAADVLVLPSYGPFETWGLAVNEAFCLGVPAIVSSHVGCAGDLVVDGRTGIVFDAGDVAGLTLALRRAVGDDVARRAWAKAARQHVESYSYDAATRGLINAVQFAMTNKDREQRPLRTRASSVRQR